MLTNEKYAGKAFSIPSFAGDATFYNDDSIVFFNSFWLKMGDSLMNSNSKEPLLFMSLNTSSLENDVADLEKRKRPKFFTPNVTGGNILIDPENKNIWLVDNYFDKITVYDNKLDVQKYLLGPENAKVKYELRTDSAIYFRNGKYYRSFYPSIYSESYVYLLYIGIKGINLDHTRIERPVTLLKFDWNGAPVEEYKLDEYLYNISLSGDGKVLYGTTAKRFGDTARLIKYNL